MKGNRPASMWCWMTVRLSSRVSRPISSSSSSRGGQGGLVVGVEVPEPGHVDGDDADRPVWLGRTEQTVAALEQLAQVELETACTWSGSLPGSSYGVDEVLE